jgi:hypothetical protein
MFVGWGDFPTATASGIPPEALNHLPWRARLAAAHEPDRVKAFQMTQDFGGPQGDALSVELDGHAAVRNYVAQVNAWLTAPDGAPAMTDDEIAGLFPPDPGAAS